MAPPKAPAQQSASKPTLIGGAYSVDLARPLPGAGGGLAAFVAIDQIAGRTGLMAVQSAPFHPARPDALAALADWPHEGMLAPLANGPGLGPQKEAAWFVVSPAPPGPPLSESLRPWGEAELLEFVLQPIATVLQGMEKRGISHRAIRLDNIFRGGPGSAAVLGTAWSAPPGLLQPPMFEPAYSAMCLPAGRGNGSIADDVYALGVVLVALTLGRIPMEGLDAQTIARRKLALGSYLALVGDVRLPQAVGDLVRGMLAEDPEHRPSPHLLTDHSVARGRRVAARPPRRGQRPLTLTGGQVWNARTLAFSIATDVEEGLHLLRSGIVDRWLRRELGDAAIAVRLEEVMRMRMLDGAADDPRADGLLSMRAVAALDPLAPLCWRGIALWPDGFGPALASAAAPTQQIAGLSDRLTEVAVAEAPAHWAVMRPERADMMGLRVQARQWRGWLQQRGKGGGVAVLRYALNSLLLCTSPILAGQAVARGTDLLPALNTIAGRAESRSGPPIDRDISAFITARFDRDVRVDHTTPDDADNPEREVMLQLGMLAELQQRGKGLAVPDLARWMLEQLAPAIAAWRYRVRREGLAKALNELADQGNLVAMTALLENPQARAADQRGYETAVIATRRIDAVLTALTEGKAERAHAARKMAHEAIFGVAMMGLTAAVVAAVFS